MWCQAGFQPEAFWRQTLRSTVLALQGVAGRLSAETKLQISVGYLTAMLSQCDPEKAPSLEDLLGESDTTAKASANDTPEDEDPRDNVRAWMAALGGAKPIASEVSDDAES